MKITVLGAGAWGIALANLLAKKNYEVAVYDLNPIYERINVDHRNPLHFSDVVLASTLYWTKDLKAALKDTDTVIFSVPSKVYRIVAREVSSLLDHKVHIVSTAKGFDPSDFSRLSDVLRSELDEEIRYPIVSLLGPSYAEEVIHDGLTCITATSVNLIEAIYIQNLFSGPYFRVYTNNDEPGAEIAAALKNVIAIAAGTLKGLGQEENARAALVTRGITEIMRYGKAFGAKDETFMGLSGIGDLSLTCNSLKSRNFSLGFEIGKADSPVSALENNTKTVEGIYTTKYVHEVAKAKGISMPITEAVYQVLFENMTPSKAVESLMIRELKKE